MSDNKTPTRYTGIDRRAPRVEPGAAKPGAREAYKTGGRHAAIIANGAHTLWAHRRLQTTRRRKASQSQRRQENARSAGVAQKAACIRTLVGVLHWP